MIKLPKKKDGSTEDCGFENHETAYVDGWNNAIDSCQQAELEGRVSVEEIRTMLNNEGCFSVAEKAFGKDLQVATVIHSRIYGDGEGENE